MQKSFIRFINSMSGLQFLPFVGGYAVAPLEL